MNSQKLALAWRNEEPLTGTPPQAVSHRYHLTVRSSEPAAAADPPSVIELQNGVLTLDGLTLSSPKITSYCMSWGQSTSHGHTFGRLHISKDRLWLSGTIGISTGNGAPSVFRVIGVAEPQQAQLSDGSAVTFQYQPDEEHPGRVVPSVQVGGKQLTGELNTSLHEDGTLALQHPDLPAKVSLALRKDGASGQTKAVAPRAITAVVSPCLTVQNLAQQDISDIEADSQTAFVQNMSEILEPQWSKAFLPQSNNLSSDPNRMCLVDQDAEWYNATYAPAFIGFGLSNDTSVDSKNKLNPQQMTSLSYYLNHEIASDPSYMRQSNVAMIPAAVAATHCAVPNLGDYLSDTTNPPGYWADQLLTYLTSPAQLQPIYGAAPDTSGNLQQQELQNVMQTVNSNAMLLTILDPSGRHAEQYYDQVYSAVFGGLLQNVSLSQDASFYESWLEEFLTQFIDYYNANLDSKPTDVSDLAKWTAGQDFNTAANALNGVAALASSISQAFSTAAQSTYVTVVASNASTNFAQATQSQAPEAGPAAGKYFLVFATVGLFINGLASLENIDSMTPEQVTASVNNLVGIASGLMALAPDILDLTKLYGNDVMAFVLVVQDGIFTDLAATTKLVMSAGATPTSVGKWMQTKVQGSGTSTTINTSGTAFSRLVKNVGQVGKYLGAVTAVIAAGISVWQLVNDIVKGANDMVIILDVAAAAFAFASAAASIAALTSETLIPAIIAAAAALGGVLVGVIASFFQEEQPPNPVDQYLQNIAGPFAAALPDPQPGWVAIPALSPASGLAAKVAARLAAPPSSAFQQVAMA